MLRTMGGQGDARIDGITRYPTAIFQRIVDYASVVSILISSDILHKRDFFSDSQGRMG